MTSEPAPKIEATVRPQYSLRQLPTCQHCNAGDPPVFLDIDGTSCKVSGDTFGELCHASGDYWWPCPRWRELVERTLGAEHTEGCVIAEYETAWIRCYLQGNLLALFTRLGVRIEE